MPGDHPVRQDGVTRPRVVVSVTATADGRVTLNRTERLLDDGPDRRWKTAWPPDVADLLAKLQLQLGALTGGLGTPSIIDGPPLEPGELPVPLRAIDVQVGTHGSSWAHYEVLAGPQ
jgi:hypothetical protein